MRKPPALLASVLFATVLGMASPVSAKGLVSYRFEPVHSQVLFFVSHLGFSHGVGRVKLGPGGFRFDADDWSTAQVDVVIDVTTLDMGDTKWTDKVRSSQFLHVERFPQARYRSRSVEKTGANTGMIHGDLTLHGKTGPVDLQVVFNKTGRDPYTFKVKAGFTAHGLLKRSAFGLDRYQGVIGEDVELRIEIEGVKDANPSANPQESGADDAVEEH